MVQAQTNTQKARPAAVSDTREVILDTAARLFREQGYAATSMRVIAAEVGIKAASLYSHFSSKDEIVAEVLRIGVERVFEEVHRAVLALDADAHARVVLRTAIHAHLRGLIELQDYTSANVRIFGQLPEHLREAALPARDAYERYWESLFVRCRKRGELSRRRNLGLARLFLLTALNGSMEWFREGKVPLKTIADEMTEMLLQGLGA